jgi:hypothetical protein
MSDNQDVVSGAPATSVSPSVPQFATAEYAHIPGTERCRFCGNTISGEYFRINSQMACSTCGTRIRAGQPTDSHKAFARGLLFGIGAALLGMAVYATFTIVTNFYLGYVALGVGWLVGTAINKGANGIGGRRYQIAAVALTYAAISISAIPIWIAGSMKHHDAAQSQSTTLSSSSASDSADTSADDEQQSSDGSQSSGRPNITKMLVQLIFIGLASPFLSLRSPIFGLIGLVILFVGLRIAFRLTAARPMAVDGPFPVNS